MTSGVCEPAPKLLLLRACSFIKRDGGGLRLSSDSQRHPGPEKVKATARCPLPWWRPESSADLQASDRAASCASSCAFAWLLPPCVSALRTFQLNFARAELKVTSRQFRLKKRKKGKKERKKGGGGQPEQAFCNYPLKLEYSSRCFYFHPVLLSFQSGEISSKVIIHLITLIV